jgi:hypothetical protein
MEDGVSSQTSSSLPAPPFDGLTSGREERPEYSASRQGSRTVGPNRYPGKHTWRQSPFETRCKEPGRFLEAATARQPGSLPRPIPLHHQAARARGVRFAIAGKESAGHFGLAIQHYSHSTAPNRRYPDLLTQRLLKRGAGRQRRGLCCRGTRGTRGGLYAERRRCECGALSSKMHRRDGNEVLYWEKFKGIVTGASDKGTWVRVSAPPVEGKLEGAVRHLDVGDRVEVELRSVDSYRGFIDFQLL